METDRSTLSLKFELPTNPPLVQVASLAILHGSPSSQKVRSIVIRLGVVQTVYHGGKVAHLFSSEALQQWIKDHFSANRYSGIIRRDHNG